MSPNDYNELKGLLLDIRDKVDTLVGASARELLTPKEVCAWLKIGRTTYQRYVDGGVFDQVRPAGRCKGRVYVRRSELLRLIEEGRL